MRLCEIKSPVSPAVVVSGAIHFLPCGYAFLSVCCEINTFSTVHLHGHALHSLPKLIVLLCVRLSGHDPPARSKFLAKSSVDDSLSEAVSAVTLCAVPDMLQYIGCLLGVQGEHAHLTLHVFDIELLLDLLRNPAYKAQQVFEKLVAGNMVTGVQVRFICFPLELQQAC